MTLRAMPLLLALILLVPAVVLAAAPPPPAELPTYSLGDKWVRSDGLYELVRVEGGTYVFAGPGREFRLSSTLGLARMHRGMATHEFSPPFELTWPLRVGQRTSHRALWQFPPRPGAPESRGGQAPALLSVNVAAWEDVTVRAGTVKAFRLELTARNERSNRTLTMQLWYAPEVRQLVKGASEIGLGTWEVVAFDRPSTDPLDIAIGEPRDQSRVDDAVQPVDVRVRSARGVSRVAVSLNGTEIAARDAPTARLELQLRQPIRLREGRNVVLVTATESDGSSRQESRVVYYERPAGPSTPSARALPPAAAAAALTIGLSAPADRARVEQEAIVVTGVVSGGRGIARVTVTLNGTEVTRRDETPPARGVPLHLPLTLREGQNTLVVTATDADGAVQQEVRAVEFARASPLAIVVRYPEDRTRIAEETSVVAAIVTSSKGVARASVSLNGTEVAQHVERTPPTSLVVTAPVTLRPGANAVVISATDTSGATRQEVRTITYEPPRVAAAPAAPAPPLVAARNQWAVVIGVGQYESPAIPRLRYTVPDAEAIYQTLIGPAGFSKDNVLLLTDRSERKPTLRNIKWALGTFLGRAAQKNDTVVIFFAGHGAPEVDTRGLERDGLAKYLIPSDADPDDLYSTALPMDELQTIFGRIEAERVVAFLDACYSGAAGGRTFASKKTRAGSVDDLFLERLTRSRGRAIVTASRPAEVSIELPELGHGIFSYFLVSGLKGAADLNRDGIVSLQELYEYVEQQVTTKSRAVGGNQHPVMKGELEGVLPLAKVHGR